MSKVESLESNMSDLLKSSTEKKYPTYSEIASKSILSPSAQVSIIRATEVALNSETRKSAVIVKNAEVPTDKSKDAEFIKSLSDSCQVSSSPKSIFRIPQKSGPPLLKLQYETIQDATRLLNSFEFKKTNLMFCANASVRPDLSKPELLKYRQAWGEAIKLNNKAKERIYTVRNLEVTKIKYREGQTPYPWNAGTKVGGSSH
uniref:Uncharacterized protein n=1 Tax=Caenorhabditis japonica TaxID=281687 RepID=A0A8R1HJW8_CAEJA